MFRVKLAQWFLLFTVNSLCLCFLIASVYVIYYNFNIIYIIYINTLMVLKLSDITMHFVRLLTKKKAVFLVATSVQCKPGNWKETKNDEKNRGWPHNPNGHYCHFFILFLTTAIILFFNLCFCSVYMSSYYFIKKKLIKLKRFADFFLISE